MIKQLKIKNYILIDELDIKFDDKLNVITGETGAGKSIIINAIDLVFAPRVSKDIIKTGTDKATIEITLNYSKNDLVEFFDQNGIENWGEEIIISKEITQNSVRSRVNGTLVNQEFVKELKDKVLDIHSQHQTYAFLQPKYHINLLDAYAKESYGSLLNSYSEMFSKYQNVLKLLDEAQNDANQTSDKIEFLKFQINEIEQADIQSENELDELKNELNILENVEKLKELTGTAFWALNGDDNSITDALSTVKSNITKASRLDENLLKIEETILNATELLQEAGSELSNYSQNLENDTQRLNEIQERIFLLDKLKRKYGNDLGEVIKTYDELKSQLDKIEFSTQNIQNLEKEKEEILKELCKSADEISQKRSDFAQVLSALIEEKLENLELPKSRFEINITPCELNNKGKDKVEFLITTNISEPLKPLAKVASGGEISRVMLAIKTIFAQSDEIDTVIFDEIDTGISGKASQSVADEIAELANFRQVILITHQPIIASKANCHFYVKKAQNTNTQIEITTLDNENRIKAIAELAGGEINPQSLEFARSLVFN